MKNILFLILILLLVGCDKVFVEPPMATNERFYCEIDGKIFRPRNKGSIYDNLTDPVLYTDFNPKDYRIRLIAINKLQAGNTITFAHSFGNNKIIGKYSITNPITTANYLRASSEQFIADNGFIEITKLDTLTRKISGKFEFEAISKLDTSKKAQIKKGEFNNLNY